MLLEWAEVKKDDVEVKEWILKNTKACPKCQVNIQKNGGCMHMTCGKCRYEFCWICMGLWSHRHQCNRDNEVHPTNQAVIFIRRFVQYNAKHETMKQAFKLDVGQYRHKMIKGKEMELEAQIIKIDFVSTAIEVLLECRRVLMHSYIFSYFMTTIDNQMYIFEDNLKYLEQCTEELSGILEHEVTPENMNEMKGKILTHTDFCTVRRRNLLDHIQEGNDKNWWRKFPIPPEELLGDGHYEVNE